MDYYFTQRLSFYLFTRSYIAISMLLIMSGPVLLHLADGTEYIDLNATGTAQSITSETNYKSLLLLRKPKVFSNSLTRGEMVVNASKNLFLYTVQFHF